MGGRRDVDLGARRRTGSGPAGRPDSKGVPKITPFATALTTPGHLGTGANAQSWCDVTRQLVHFNAITCISAAATLSAEPRVRRNCRRLPQAFLAYAYRTALVERPEWCQQYTSSEIVKKYVCQKEAIGAIRDSVRLGTITGGARRGSRKSVETWIGGFMR